VRQALLQLRRRQQIETIAGGNLYRLMRSNDE
jgi:hypothetical protein